MIRFLKQLFTIDKKPTRGLMWFEWVSLAYALLTLLVILFTYTKVVNPDTMIWGRMRLVVMTGALWLVYRLAPCRFTVLARVVGQMLSLTWWYPDTYEINRMFPNLDHLFAQFEQNLFGCQPALLFSQVVPNKFFSEMMDMGYTSYYPLIIGVLLFYFLCRYTEFECAAFIILATFFLSYVIFIFLPVTGPQYYYGAAGLENIANGVFPNVHDYFSHHLDRLPTPGWTDGFFYQRVVEAHDAGERPTAAFPSSHISVTTVVVLLAWHTRCRWLFWLFVPFFVLMFAATVYIRAHYLIDAIAGLATGILFYFLFTCLWNMKKRSKSH